MRDTLTTIRRSRIQHGPASDRIYLMHLDVRDLPELTGELEQLARQHGYGKIFAKAPAGVAAAFTAAGYTREACIPGYYHGRETADLWGRFLTAERARDTDAAERAAVLDLVRTRGTGETPAAACGTPAGPDDAAELAALYREVFATYPFPIHDPVYLQRTMAEHISYFVVREAGRMVAAASAERDEAYGSVEMTDFATLPAWRGRGLAGGLLRTMEAAMRARGMATAYTIARAVSAGINLTFARAGYICGGTLRNNTQIAGRIESMNVWYRPLAVQ